MVSNPFSKDRKASSNMSKFNSSSNSNNQRQTSANHPQPQQQQQYESQYLPSYQNPNQQFNSTPTTINQRGQTLTSGSMSTSPSSSSPLPPSSPPKPNSNSIPMQSHLSSSSLSSSGHHSNQNHHSQSNNHYNQSSDDGPKHLQLQLRGQKPSFTFVCLGVGGGPLEGDCSCYLVKPADMPWHAGTVVVEGGSWLGALKHVCERTGPNSPFHDCDFPRDLDSPALRAGFIGSFAKSFLISHAHLDHILGLVLSSASLPGKRSVYGLTPTLENIMDLFNGKIWPKLASWKEDEPHTVYHMRSLEAQRATSLSEVLSVLPFALSHGLNPAVPPAPPTPTPSYSTSSPEAAYFSKRYSLPLSGAIAAQQMFRMGSSSDEPERRSSNASGNSLSTSGGLTGISNSSFPPGERPVFTSPFAPSSTLVSTESSSYQSSELGTPVETERGLSPTPSTNPESEEGGAIESLPSLPPTPSASAPPEPQSLRIKSSSHAPPTASRKTRRPRTAQGSEKAGLNSKSGPPEEEGRPGKPRGGPRRVSVDKSPPALDSTAFFIRHERTGKEVLFFGDVEPDCVSQSPRNHIVWQHAAKRFVQGKLNTVFLECSFPASHPTQFLYGHLSVTHLYQELRTLSRYVILERRRITQKNGNGLLAIPPSPMAVVRGGAAVGISDEETISCLNGLAVVIIHVKTALFPSYARPPSSVVSERKDSTTSSNNSKNEDTPRAVDPRSMQDRILEELREVEADSNGGLGVRFEMAEQGMRIEC